MISRRLIHDQTGEVWEVVGADGDLWTLRPAAFGPVRAFTVEEIRETFKDAGNATAPERASETSGWKRLAAFAERAASRRASSDGLLTPEQSLAPDALAAAKARALAITQDDTLMGDALTGLLPLSPLVEQELRTLIPEAFEDELERP